MSYFSPSRALARAPRVLIAQNGDQAAGSRVTYAELVRLKLIFGVNCIGCENALQMANILKPTDQLIKMTKQFAIKSSTHPKFTKWFVNKPNT